MAGDGVLVARRRWRRTAGRPPARGGRLRNLLVVGEVATAVLLLFGAGLLLRTLLAVESVDRGYRADSVLTMIVDPLGSSYPTPDAAAAVLRRRRARGAAASRRARRGVGHHAAARRVVSGGSSFVQVAGDPPPAREPAADRRLPDREPRLLRDAGSAGRRRPGLRRSRHAATAPPVCIVNEAFVRSAPAGPVADWRCASRCRDGEPPRPPSGARDRRRGAAGEGRGPTRRQDLVQVYVPLAQSTHRRHLPGRAAGVGRAPRRWRRRSAPRSAASTRSSSSACAT